MKISLIVGLALGDEGKGAHCDFLARRASGPVTVVRFNGGAQAGHNVVTPDGRHHTFRQFGAGTFAGAYTYLSRYMLVNPITLLLEAKALEKQGVKDPLELISLDRDALVTNLYQVAANRLTETLRGEGRHGSCGMGIGETVSDFLAYPEMALKVEDLQNRTALLKKLTFSRELKLARFTGLGLSEYDPNWIGITESDVDFQVDRYLEIGKLFRIVDRVRLRHLVKQSGDLIFEGAQGVLLDQDYGFHPYTTWSSTTFKNALELLDEARFDSAEATRIGVIRGYTTRHGAGPFPTDDPSIEIEGDRDNVTGVYQQRFRVGAFDTVLAQYARRVVGRLDEVIVTNLDKIKSERPKICTGYQFPLGVVFKRLKVQKALPPKLSFQEQLTSGLMKARPVYRELKSRQELIDRIEEALERPVSWCSVGPTAADKLYRPPQLRI